MTVRVRILAAMSGVAGLVLGALTVASSPATAADPALGGDVVTVSPAGDVTTTYENGPWSAVVPRGNADLFGVKADTGLLARITGANAALDAFPSGVADQEILSLSNSAAAALTQYLAVVTEDGLPHAWGGNGVVTSPDTATSVVNAFDAAGLTSEAALGGGGAPAAAVEVAAGVGVLGILLADGRVGVLDAPHGYRILDFNAATLAQGEKVVQIDAFSATAANKSLVLRLENGGALTWRWSSTDAQGTLTIPQIPDIAGRTGASPGVPLGAGVTVPDPLVDVSGSTNG
jgi:hypothetical protein